MSYVYETPATRSFVSPRFCQCLVDIGLSSDVLFTWKVKGDDVVLYTNEFDPDNYYKETAHLIEEIDPVDFVLPAYNLKDIEPLLPNHYHLSMVEMGYQLVLQNTYPVESCINIRMPDAFANMLLQCIKSRYVYLHIINSFIKKQMQRHD